MADNHTTKRGRLVKAANGGGILANQILGCDFAVPVLSRKAALVQGRINRVASGAVPSNSDAQFVQIIADQVGTVASIMAYNHPDAGYYATQNVIRAFSAGGLGAVVAEIRKLADEARATADLINR